MAASSPSVESIARGFVGPILIGSIFNVCLYGILLMQMHEYYRTFKRTDTKWIRGIVAFCLAVTTISAALSAYCSYYYGVIQFGNVEQILMDVPPFAALVLTICIGSAPVQIFFGWRVKKLTGNIWLFAFCITAAIIQIGCGVGTVVIGTPLRDFRKFHSFQGLVITWQVLSSITDILITVTLVNYLRHRKTGIQSTDDILRRITRMTIQTGAVTTVIAIVAMALFVGIRNNTDFMLNIALPPLYANCLLSSLNSRAEWVNENPTVHVHSMPQRIKVMRTVEQGSWTDDGIPPDSQTISNPAAVIRISRSDFSRPHLKDDDNRGKDGSRFGDPLGVSHEKDRGASLDGSPGRAEVWDEQKLRKPVAL